MSTDEENEIRAFGRQFTCRNIVGASLCVRYLAQLDQVERFLGVWRGPEASLESIGNLFEGFKLALLVPIYNLFQEAITSPEIFGITPVDGLAMMFHWNEGEFPIPSGDTAHEALVRKLWLIRTELIRSQTWAQLRVALGDCLPAVEGMGSLLETHYSAKLADPPETKRLSELAPGFALDFLHVAFHDTKNLLIAYDEFYRSGSKPRRERRVRLAQSTVATGSDRDSQLQPGVGFAVSYLWWRLVEPVEFEEHQALIRRISLATTLEEFDDCFGEASRVIGLKLGKYGLMHTLRHGMELEQTSPITDADRSVLALNPAVSGASALSLDALFEMRPVRVGASHPYAQVSYFMALFTGLLSIARSGGEKVRLIRLRHRESPGSVFSYAIFIPAFGTFFSNASEYWLIVEAANDFSGNGSQAWRTMESLIKQGADDVVVREFEIPDIDDLKRYAESRQVQYLRARVVEFESLLGDFRGSISELLVAELLRSEGFEILGIRRKLRCLAGKETDVVATRQLRGAEVLLVECKAYLQSPTIRYEDGGFDPESDLSRDLSDSLKFVKLVRNRLSDSRPLCDELKISSPRRITPVVAVAGEVETGVAAILIREGAEVWDWNDLRERFVRAKIERSLWEPLERFAERDERAQRALRLGDDFLDDPDVSLNK